MKLKIESGLLLLLLSHIPFTSAQEDANKKHKLPSKEDIEALGSAAVALENCPLLRDTQLGDNTTQSSTPAFGDKTLSMFWAQEFIGLDLANVYMKKLRNGAGPNPDSGPQSVVVQILDSSKSDHGKSVHYLLTSPDLGSCAGTACKVESFKNFSDGKSFFDIGESEKSGIFSYNLAAVKALNEIIQGKVKADVVSVSMTGFSKETMNVFSNVGRGQNAIVVLASGNILGGDPNQDLAQETQSFRDGIVVGSLSTEGRVSDISVRGETVDILAPSNRHLSGIDGFSGTSGAQPLVAGVVAQIRSLLKNAPLEVVRAIIKETAIPTHNKFFTPQVHGAGTINALAALKMAEQLAQACAEQTLTPSVRASCWMGQLKKEKSKPQIFDEKFSSRIKAVFGCNEDGNISQVSENLKCQGEDSKQVLFNELREKSLLNTDVAPYWNQLSCIHEKLAFPKNAILYRSVGFRGWPPVADAEARRELVGQYRRLLKKPSVLQNLSLLGPAGLNEFKDYGEKLFSNPVSMFKERGDFLSALIPISKSQKPYVQSFLEKHAEPISKYLGYTEGLNEGHVISLAALYSNSGLGLANFFKNLPQNTPNIVRIQALSGFDLENRREFFRNPAEYLMPGRALEKLSTIYHFA